MKGEFNLISNKAESKELIEIGFDEYIKQCTDKELNIIICDLGVNTMDGVFNWITYDEFNLDVCKFKLKKARDERGSRNKDT